MIRIFRRYTPFNLIYLVPFAILLCLGAFINLPENLQAVFFEPAIDNLTASMFDTRIDPATSIFATVALTILQGILLNFIINKYNLLGKPNYLTALLYVTLASLLTPFLTLSPALICNFLLIWMIDKFLFIYRKTEINAVMFDLGLMVALGTLFYFPFISMFLLLWIGLVIFRPFNWREWIAGVMGFITVYFILFIIYLWLEQLEQFRTIWLPLTRSFPNSLNIDLHDYLVLIAPAFILVLFLLSLRQNFFKSIVHVRKSFQLFFFMLVLAAASFYLNVNFEEYHFLLCIPPLAIYMAYYFTYARIPWIYEGVFAILVLALLYFQWF